MSLETRVGMEPTAPENTGPKYEIRPFRPEDAQLIYDTLETPNWAPWLAASPETIAKRAEVFPQGQLAVWEGDQPVATLSLARFNYDGNPDNLPKWDDLAGDPPTYEATHVPDGNAVGMMSINVRPDRQGAGLTKEIIAAAKKATGELGIEHVMGSFRPSQYGAYSNENPELNMEDYANMTTVDKAGNTVPQDPWLRALHRNGMRMLRVDDGAMVVPDVPIAQVEEWSRTYKPDQWKKDGHLWRCGETGVWVVAGETATYLESNVWGILDQQPESQSVAIQH